MSTERLAARLQVFDRAERVAERVGRVWAWETARRTLGDVVAEVLGILRFVAGGAGFEIVFVVVIR